MRTSTRVVERSTFESSSTMRQEDTPSVQPSPPPPQDAAQPHLVAIAGCVHALRQALLDAGGGLCDLSRPRLLARSLGVNRGLAWRLAAIATEASAGEMLRKMPRPKSLHQYLEACAAAGAGSDAVARAREAIDRLERAVAASGEDRRAIPVLLLSSGLDDLGITPFAAARQHLFDGASVIWGVEASVGFRLCLLWPGAGDTISAAQVRGLVDLSLLREGSWPIGYSSRTVTDQNQPRQLTERPIDPDSDLDFPLIRRFCAPPDIQVRIGEHDGMRRFEIVPESLGHAGRLTCVMGTIIEDVYQSASGDDPTAALMMIIETPIRRLQFDLLAHESIRLATPRPLRFCDRLTRPHGFVEARLDAESLPLAISPTPLNGVDDDVAAPHLPWYPDLVKHVAKQLGLEAGAFSGHRFSAAYPPIATAAVALFSPVRRDRGGPHAAAGADAV